MSTRCQSSASFIRCSQDSSVSDSQRPKCKRHNSASQLGPRSSTDTALVSKLWRCQDRGCVRRMVAGAWRRIPNECTARIWQVAGTGMDWEPNFDKHFGIDAVRVLGDCDPATDLCTRALGPRYVLECTSVASGTLPNAPGTLWAPHGLRSTSIHAGNGQARTLPPQPDTCTQQGRSRQAIPWRIDKHRHCRPAGHQFGKAYGSAHRENVTHLDLHAQRVTGEHLCLHLNSAFYRVRRPEIVRLH